MDKERILGLTPRIELLIRKIYYSDNTMIKGFVNKFREKNDTSRTQGGSQNLESAEKLPQEQLLKYLDKLCINNGDILIVHSSMDELQRFDLTVNDLFSYLRSRLGQGGTLVIPAFPLYNARNYDTERKKYIYDTKRTLCSTGMLPALFLRQKAVLRSPFPWNSLAAQGPKAEAMMERNLETEFAHGKLSAWGFCAENHAKVLLLGVKSSHTTTIVHCAEDYLGDLWPIGGWYETSEFILSDGEVEKEFQIRIRKPGWAKYNASWYRSNQLKKENLLIESMINGVNIGFIDDSNKLVNYIIQRTMENKPFFVVPRMYYKNEKTNSINSNGSVQRREIHNGTD